MIKDYDYKAQVKQDIENYLYDTGITDPKAVNRDDLYDDLFIEDSVTGNGSGSYLFNESKAQEYVEANKDLLREAIDGGFITEEKASEWWLDDDYESLDVSLRCYVLSDALDEVLDSYIH